MAVEFPSRGRLPAVALSILLFAVSLACMAFSSDGRDRTPGWSAFTLGWIPALIDIPGFLRGQFEYWTCIAWFANPLLLGCWVLTAVRQRRQALVFGAATLVLGLVFLATRQLPMGDHDLKDVVPGGGYFLWVASMLAALAGAACTARPEPADPLRHDDRHRRASGR